MYALGIAVILLFAGGLYLYYDMVPAMPMYVRFMYHVTTHIL
jgi:hypothetical protein